MPNLPRRTAYEVWREMVLRDFRGSGHFPARTQPPIEIRSPSAINDPVSAAVELLALSPLHRNWTIRDFKRLLVPPMEQEQCVFGVQAGYLVAFVTWALLSLDAYEGLVRRSRILRADDWTDWTSGDELWSSIWSRQTSLRWAAPFPSWFDCSERI